LMMLTITSGFKHSIFMIDDQKPFFFVFVSTNK